MKNSLIILFFAVFAAIGCQSPTDKPAATAVDTPPPPPPPMDTSKKPDGPMVGGSTFTCYQFVDKSKDVHSCQIETRATAQPFVSGYFDWSPFQKDGGHGILKNGVLKDGIMTADFIYMIEGNVQAEEVYFKMEDAKITQMQGELIEQKGKLVAKDKTKLKAGIVMARVDCAKLKTTIDGIKGIEKQLVMPMK